MRNRFENIAGLRVGAYIRVSHDEQVKHGYSLDAQRENLQNFIKENHLQLVDFYEDEGITARKNLKNRKAFKRMLEDIEAHKMDLIIFIKLDRWFRNIQDYYITQQVLDKNNVQWIATTEEYDTTTASGRLNLNIRLSIAQDEADRTSERIKFVFDEKKRRREALTRSVPIGYKISDNHYVIDDEKAPLVRDYFKFYLETQSIVKAVDMIRDKYNFPLKYSRARGMLTMDAYIGTFHNIPNYAPPLLDLELYEAAKALSHKRSFRQNQTGNIYIFSGMIACRHCGKTMVGFHRVMYSQRRGERDYYGYRCENYWRDHNCTNNHTFGEFRIEEFLLSNLRDLADHCIRDYTIEKKREESTPQPNPQKLKNKIDKLRRLYMDDLIDLDSYKREYTAYQEQLKKMEPQKEDLNKTKQVDALRQLLNSDFETCYQSMSREERRSFWSKVVHRIYWSQEEGFSVDFF